MMRYAQPSNTRTLKLNLRFLMRNLTANSCRRKSHEKKEDRELMSAEGSQQPVAYVISAVEGFVDEATVRRYAELTGPAIQQYSGRFIVSNAEPVFVEGELLSGHLSMVAFPSMEHAQSWYDSPDYAEARALTPAAFRGRLLMFVEGLRPPK